MIGVPWRCITDQQAHVDKWAKVHYDRQSDLERFSEIQPALPPDIPLTSMTLEEFFADMDRKDRAEHAVQRLKDRNGIPEPQPTRYQWPTA